MERSRVLIVDRDDALVETSKFLLRAAAYVVEGVSDVPHALAIVPDFLPDVILTEVQTPETDGFELARRLKADPATRHIAIIAFTAQASKGDGRVLQEAGFNGYIGRPVDIMTFAAAVRFWLEGPLTARTSHFVWP